MNNRDHIADYEQTAAYFRELHETRFRLLTLLPLSVGAAIALLPEKIVPLHQIAFGALGLLITIGLTIYDQRNSMIYDRLVRRAKFLERLMNLPPLQCEPWNADRKWGGAFMDRPNRRHLLDKANIKIPLIWHDLGLSIVYAATISGWTFILADGMLKWRLTPGTVLVDSLRPHYVSCAVGLLAFTVLTFLARMNDHENEMIDKWIESDEALNDIGSHYDKNISV